MELALGARLKSERLRLGMTQTELGMALGVSKTTQVSYEGSSRTPDASYLQKAQAVGMDVGYLLSGRRAETAGDYVVIPPYAMPDIGAPDGPAASTTGGLSLNRNWLTQLGLDPGTLRVIEVVGESMRPRLSEGDKVLVDLSDREPMSGRAYVLCQGNELLVKYCQRLPEGLLRVSCENTSFPSYDIDLRNTDAIKVVGRARATTHVW